MKGLKTLRAKRKVSQRNLARLAGISYKTLQLLESGKNDPKMSTVRNIVSALGYPRRSVERRLAALLKEPVDSLTMAGERILEEGEKTWKTWFFNFVDAFRKGENLKLIQSPPPEKLSKPLKALFVSTAEALCAEKNMPVPEWCYGIDELAEPWFVSGVESLKAMALVESPVHFRKRNVFVLDNFLNRA